MRTTLFHDWRASPNQGERADGADPDILLLHYTGTATARIALDWLCLPTSQVSCHYLIDDDGGIVQMVGEDRRAWHAGRSYWAGETDINSKSIGIEIQNPGPEAGYPDFPEPQMAAVENLCLDILARHDIPPERVLAHSDVAPGRKIDPGEKFDWQRLAAKDVGHWVEPAPMADGPVLAVGDKGDPVHTLQDRFRAYGYGLEITGEYDMATEQVVYAFQQHFRQALCDGRCDLSTLKTLDQLVRTRQTAV
jgi:N-acetylmuramoyl-L-alanine amidase